MPAFTDCEKFLNSPSALQQDEKPQTRTPRASLQADQSLALLRSSASTAEQSEERHKGLCDFKVRLEMHLICMYVFS